MFPSRRSEDDPLNTVKNVLSTEARELVSGLNSLSAKLYSAGSNADENFICGSTSFGAVLLMLLTGAQSSTAEEIRNALGIKNSDLALSAFKEIIDNTRTGAVDFSLRNRFWTKSGYILRPEYLENLKLYLGGDTAEIDFNNAEEAAEIINKWISIQTKGKIKKLIQSSMIEPLLRLIIVNTAYFCGRWEKEFDPLKTREEYFWTSPNDKKLVPTMKSTRYVAYAEIRNAKLIDLPFRRDTYEWVEEYSEEFDMQIEQPKLIPDGGSDFCLSLVLPSRTTKLKEMIKLDSFQSEVLNTQRRSLFANIRIPKFDLKRRANLTDFSSQLGLSESMSVNADFSAATDNPEGLLIGNIVHQATIKVDEVGAVAAAATAGFAAGAGIPSEPELIKFNRPFLIYLRDTKTGLVHFIGHVTDPLENE